MTSRVQRADGSGQIKVPTWKIGGTSFSVLAFLVECLIIVCVSVTTGTLYHHFVYGSMGEVDRFLAIGWLTALIYTVPFALRSEYDMEDFVEGRRATSRMLVIWSYAFVTLAVVGFLTKTTGLFSRGWLILFFVTGLVGVIAIDAAIAIILREAIARGRIERRRLMLIGADDEVVRTLAEIGPAASARVVATGHLPTTAGGDASSADADGLELWLDETIRRARSQRIDDIIVLMDWSHGGTIERIVTALTAMPVGVHVGTARIIGRFANPQVKRFGRSTTLSLAGAPLGGAQLAVKRLFDIAAAATALALLSPLLVTLVVLIKRDSPGPAFFRQRRRGYNHEEFRIWKFRTMTTMDDGAVVKQAERGDVRVTRVGRWLRRFNLDELPQLFNVLLGEMSLVGPRPHAVAHDEHYEKRILEYPRRLNVKPGITGWAQVHGYRGATENEDDMRRRVEHDIYYIENWSLVLDIYIVAMTVLSPRAYRNAY